MYQALRLQKAYICFLTYGKLVTKLQRFQSVRTRAGFSPEGYGIRERYALQAGYVIRATPSCWHATP